MIDICIPFEDFEYNAVGHYRLFFVLLELIFMIYLTILYYRMPQIKTPTKFYVFNLLLIAWPLLPFRIFKMVFTLIFPFEATQSYLLCTSLRVETTLQYAFSLAHLQTLAYFSFLVTKHRSVSFDVTVRMSRTLISLDVISLLVSVPFVNFRSSRGITDCIYAGVFTISFFIYIIFNFSALIFSTCRCLRKRKPDDENYYNFFWFHCVQFLIAVAHAYQFCGTLTFLIPVAFPQFAGDYQIIFRYVTGVQAVRFMVSVVFATVPIVCLPPMRRQILKPILRLKQDRVAAISDIRSPDQIEVTFTTGPR